MPGAWARFSSEEHFADLDVDALVSMLAHDAMFAMPPEPTWFTGAEAIGAFLAAWPLAPEAPDSRLVPIRANGQLAFAHCDWSDEQSAYMPHAITVLTLTGTRVAEMTVFRSARAFAGFELPERIAP